MLARKPTPPPPFFLLAACFQQVPQEELLVTSQHPFWGDVSPNNISSASQFLQGDFRLFNAYGGTSGNGTGVGSTPDPCHTVLTGMLGIIFGGGESSRNMGTTDISGSGQAYQVAEGRLGAKGQAGSQTINNRTVPWIYSVIEFDSSGHPTVSDHSTFPTFFVYINGALQPGLSSAQSTVDAFVNGYDSSNENSWSPVP